MVQASDVISSKGMCVLSDNSRRSTTSPWGRPQLQGHSTLPRMCHVCHGGRAKKISWALAVRKVCLGDIYYRKKALGGSKKLSHVIGLTFTKCCFNMLDVFVLFCFSSSLTLVLSFFADWKIRRFMIFWCIQRSITWNSWDKLDLDYSFGIMWAWYYHNSLQQCPTIPVFHELKQFTLCNMMSRLVSKSRSLIPINVAQINCQTKGFLLLITVYHFLLQTVTL